MNWLIDVVPVMFVIMFLTVFILVMATLLTGLARRKKDNASARLTVPAVLVSRRTEYHRTAAEHSMGFTEYYATFQVESGDRMEFSVSGQEYGMLAEGDRGQLSFQGTRFLGFVRDCGNLNE